MKLTKRLLHLLKIIYLITMLRHIPDIFSNWTLNTDAHGSQLHWMHTNPISFPFFSCKFKRNSAKHSKCKIDQNEWLIFVSPVQKCTQKTFFGFPIPIHIAYHPHSTCVGTAQTFGVPVARLALENIIRGYESRSPKVVCTLQTKCVVC